MCGRGPEAKNHSENTSSQGQSTLMFPSVWIFETPKNFPRPTLPGTAGSEPRLLGKASRARGGVPETQFLLGWPHERKVWKKIVRNTYDFNDHFKKLNRNAYDISSKHLNLNGSLSLGKKKSGETYINFNIAWTLLQHNTLICYGVLRFVAKTSKSSVDQGEQIKQWNACWSNIYIVD